MGKKQYNFYDFLENLVPLLIFMFAIFALCVLYIACRNSIHEEFEELKNWDKKLEKCELNSFDNNDQTYKFICKDDIEIFIKEINDEQWENIKEKNHCKIISYDYETRIKTWSCSTSVIVKNKFK